MVPAIAAIRLAILRAEHDSLTAGHMGQQRTYDLVDRLFWWPSLRQDVTTYVTTCHACQRDKAGNQPKAGLLQPLDIPERRWDDVSMDFITQLPTTLKGNTQIVVFVDRLTKMVHLAALPTHAGAKEVAECFRHNVIRLHGLPKRLLSDRDTKFTGSFWHEVTQLLGVSHRMSTAYHPQTDGQTERTNQVLEDYLRHWISPKQDNWDALLDCAEFAMNNAVNQSTGFSPFKLNYAQDPHTPLSIHADTRTPASRDFMLEMEGALLSAKRSLQAAQDRYKHYYDLKRRPAELSVGQKVLLRTTNLTFKGGGARKLFPKWVGPFEVTERVGALSYRLELPPYLNIHPVFHVELLKPYLSGSRHQPPPPPVDVAGFEEYAVEAIVRHREVTRGRHPPKLEYLVKWAGYGPEHNTWEPAANLSEVAALDSYQAANPGYDWHNWR